MPQRQEGETQQQRHAAGSRLPQGRPAWCGQPRIAHGSDGLHQQRLRRITQHTAQYHGARTEQQELVQEDAQHLPLLRTHATHHRAGIQMARDEMPCRQGQRHTCQNHSGERRQSQEMLGAFQRSAYLGARIAHIFQALTHDEVIFQPRAHALHLWRGARHQQAVVDAAALLHQTPGRQVGRIEHHARRKTGKPDRLVHILHHLCRQAQTQVADAHLIAQPQPKALHQARIRPQRAARRNALRDVQRAIIDLYLAAQRITRFDGLDVCQYAFLCVRDHAGKGRAFHHTQAALLRGLAILSGKGCVVLRRRSAPSRLVASCCSASRTRSAKNPTVEMLPTASTSATSSTRHSPARQSRRRRLRERRRRFIYSERKTLINSSGVTMGQTNRSAKVNKSPSPLIRKSALPAIAKCKKGRSLASLQ